MSAVIQHGRTLGFSVVAHAGTFPGSLTYVAVHVAEFPDIGTTIPEVEVTDSASTGVERIAGMADGDEFTLTAYYKGSDGTDWGIGASTLYTKAKAGAILGFKDSYLQTDLSADLVKRFDAVGLGAKHLGGGQNDPQRVQARFRITGSIHEAAA